MCVYARLLCGLGCKRAVRTHLADKQAAGRLGNRRVFVCLSLCVCLIEHREEKRARAQAGEVNSARPHCSLLLSDHWICTHRHPPNVLADIAKKNSVQSLTCVFDLEMAKDNSM